MGKLIKTSAMLPASGLILTSCGGNKGLEEKKENKQLTYTMVKDIGDMNPHICDGSMSAESMIHEPLIRNAKDGVKPLLAKKWDMPENGKTYTSCLRNDVKFHDGTSSDVDTVKENIDAVQENRKLHSWLKILILIDNVRVKDKYAVESNLKETYQSVLVELAMPRPYVFVSPEDSKNDATKSGVRKFDGTDPFKLDEHEKDKSIDSNRND